ncbi:MAG: head GIN domain-containing protein [Cyclobacteriaceae bacterium]
MKTFSINLLSLCFTLVSFQLLSQTTETRSVSPFTRISTGGSWDVVIQKGDKPEVRLESRNLDLEKVKTEVKDQTLRVYLEKGKYRYINLKVFITYTQLEEIRISGSGDLNSPTVLNAGDLAITLSGSGDASFSALSAENLSITMSGSGDMYVGDGEVGGLEITQSGSGDFKGLDMHSLDAHIRKSGSGDTSLGVSETLSVRASGSGDVQYRGNPEKNDIMFSGSGRLTKK